MSSTEAGAGPRVGWWRSVRVRITLVAVLVTAVAVSLTSWLLVQSLEDNQLRSVRRDAEDVVDQIAEHLEAGDTLQEAVAAAPASTSLVQIANEDCIIVADSLVAASGGTTRTTGAVRTAEPPVADGLRDPCASPPADGFVPPPQTTEGDGGASTSRPDPGGDDCVVSEDGATDAEPATGTCPPGQAIESLNLAGAYPTEQVTRTVDTQYGELTVTVATPVDQVANSVEALRRNLLVGLPVLIGLVALAAWWLVGRALRPVELIRTEAESIGGSTLHRRVPEPATDDEVGRLAHTMNAMLDRLDEAARRQRQFVADASHELRSPTAAIRTDLEVALHEGDGADWPAVARAVLVEEARLETLLSDLLLLAADDEGATTTAGTPVDLTDLVAEEFARSRRVPVTATTDTTATSQASTNGHSTGSGTASATVTATTVIGSRSQIQRVLGNLVDNAARHAQSQVRIAVSSDGDWVRLRVDDDGRGIPIADRERVFGRFTRLDDGRARGEGGAGLGLAVVRSIVTRHGGFVWAETSPLGGARFVVSLPTKPAQGPVRLGVSVISPS